MPTVAATSPDPSTDRFPVLLAIFGLGVSAVMTQLVLMREMLSVFAGNEMVLGIILGNWLLLTGIGTWLGRWLPRMGNLHRALFVFQILIALLPPLQVLLLRTLRDVVFIRGAAVGVSETVLSSLLLLAPYCLVSGAMLMLACAISSQDDSPSGAGRVYVVDSAGSIAGGALFSFVLVRWFDHIALLGFPAILNLLLAAFLSFRRRRRVEEPTTQGRTRPEETGAVVAHTVPGAAEPPARTGGARLRRALASFSRQKSGLDGVSPHQGKYSAPLGDVGDVVRTVLAGVLALGVLLLWRFGDLDAVSTARQYPGQNVLLRTNSPYGRLVVTEAAGQITFFENGLPVIATHNTEQIEETVHYAMAQRLEAARVLLVGGGISGTAAEILKHGVRTVSYLEIDPAILAARRRFLGGHLADARLHTVPTDGRRFIRQAPEPFDVVIVDVSEPATSQLNRFYTAQFFGEVKRALSKNGVLSFSLGHYENYVSPELARMLASAHRTLRQSFTNVLMIPGGRVFFLASDGPLSTDIARRLEERGVMTRLVNRHYLDAVLSPDRLSDLQRAVAQPASINQDFTPVLYYYHLRHWMSQFTVRFGLLQGALTVLLVMYLARLRAVPLALFASGFAASALEVVLLLAFQILCGSLYQQVGLIVTTFMGGLALGAWLMNRQLARKPGPFAHAFPTRRHLAILTAAVALFALLLPAVLTGLARANVSLFAVPVLVALLALLLAALVGMQFPLANHLALGDGAATPSRLFTADFVGASLGALLPSTLLIPMSGVTTVCVVTAALNVAAGAAVLWRQAGT